MKTNRTTRAKREKDKLRKRNARKKDKEDFIHLPVDGVWKNAQINHLKLTVSQFQDSISQCDVRPLLSPSTFRRITPDGNCFFRCLSYIITGTEDFYHDIRLNICHYLETHAEEVLTILPLEAQGNVINYLHMSQMYKDKTWASEVEISAAAMMLQTNIYVYTKHGNIWTWVRHTSGSNVTNKGIYIYHKDLVHFDVVLAVQNDTLENDFSDHSNVYTSEDIQQNVIQRKKVKNKLRCSTKYKADNSFCEMKKSVSRQCQNRKYQTDNVFRNKKKLFSCEAKRKRYRDSETFQRQEKHRSCMKYTTNSLLRHRLKAMSKAKYTHDKVFQDKKKQQSRKKYSVNKNHKEAVLNFSKMKYAKDKQHRSRVKNYSKVKYAENKVHRENVKGYSKGKYADNKVHQESVKKYSKVKYTDNKVHREKVKGNSKGKYADNKIHQERVKKYSKMKYADNKVHREKVKGYSKGKYADNKVHQERVKTYSKVKYADNKVHREKVKGYSKGKYADNKVHQERVKTYSKVKYADNKVHRERVKKYSKVKYADNKVHREKVKEYSKSKYQTFTSFRNGVRASSLKKYATNALFRQRLKSFLKTQYRENKTIQKEKSRRVTVSRKSISKAVQNFRKIISETPQYVCTVCIRMLYRKQVKKWDRNKYSVDGILSDTVSQCLTGSYVHSCEDDNCDQNCIWTRIERDKEWICHNCHRYLLSGKMPPQANVNGLFLAPVPPVLQKLNALERQLVSLRIPFMKLVTLPRGGQKGVKGPVVNVPSDLNTVTTSLPRNIDDAQLIKVKLKRKLSYKGHYKYQWVNPTNVLDALRYLQQNNPLYKDILLNDSWINAVKGSDLVQPSSDVSGDDSDEEPPENDSGNNIAVETVKSSSDDHGHDSNKEPTQKDSENNIPVETCLQPVDIAQDIMDFTDKSLCLAPGENMTPQNIFQEKDSDVMAFPALLPDGQFGLFHERDIKLSPAKYFNARLFSADTRFANDKEFLFYAQYVTEINYISSNISIALRKGTTSTSDGTKVTASMLINSEKVSQILKSDIGYRFLQPVRGTPPYWQRTMKDLYAMIRQLGIPTWFVTFSAAETRWNEVTETLLYINGDNRSAGDIEWLEKCTLISENSVTCARMFNYRVQALISNLLLSPAAPIGNILDLFYRTEFQQRGSPHIHCLFWVKDAPKLDEDSDKEVCRFIDKYVTCKLPDENTDPELFEIVSAVQTHSKSHSKSCKKYSSTCRFNFPKPPVQNTFIAKPNSDDTDGVKNTKAAPTIEEIDEMCKNASRTSRQILKDIWDLITLDHPDLSFDDILRLTNVSYEQYEQCLREIVSKNTVNLQRDLPDIWVNNYNEHLLRAWNANIDIQYVTDAYACVAYILSYISKAETEMGDLLQNAKEEAQQGNSDVTSAMRKIGNVYLHNREVSAQEAAYRVCSLPLKHCSRDVMFIPAGNNIIKMSLPINVIKSRSFHDGNNENIWMASIHDKYYARPRTEQFDQMCLAEFCSKYRILSPSQKPKPNTGTQTLPVFELQNPFGYIQQRKPGKEAVIRYPRFDASKTPEDFYLSLMQLYLPHRIPFQRQTDDTSYEEFVRSAYMNEKRVMDIIERNRHNFEIDAEQLNKAWADIQEGRIPGDSWTFLAPEAEVERLEIEMEKEPDSKEVQEEIPELADKSVNSSEQSKHAFDYIAPTYKKKEIQDAMRDMNDTQQKLFYQISDWCLKVLQKRNPDPFHLFLTGGAGTGKSHIIKCIHHEATRILSKCTTSPDSISVLLSAPTGTAAFNIGGLTIHSAFNISKKAKLPYQPLGESLLNTLRSKYDSLHILIIDEISMVGQKLLSYIHGRLSQLKHSKKPFGNVSVLAVGDFYQLPPVRAHPLYKSMASDFVDLWYTHFTIATLTEVMRQKEDGAFAAMLNRLRTHKRGQELFPEDSQALLSLSCEEIPTDDADVLHIFATNKEVDGHNADMISNKCSPVLISTATDYYLDRLYGQLRQKPEPYSTCAQEDLQTIIQLGIGARVMLTRNIDTSDGLVNGAFGTVASIDSHSSSKINAVYVKFDDPRIGRQHLKTATVTDKVKLGAVQVKQFEDTLSGKSVTRKQFPLRLGWAATIHKVQGMTVNKIVVSLEKIFAPGMAYVALSRTTSLAGLHILHYNSDAIYSSEDITEAIQKMPPFLPPNMGVHVCPEDNFTIVLHNTEGILPHLEDIKCMKDFHNCQIICFTETWFEKGRHVPKSLFPQHKVELQHREDAYTDENFMSSKFKSSKKGGVMAFLEKDLQFSRLPLKSKNVEFVAAIVARPVNLLVCIVYRPPSYPLPLFLQSMTSLLTEIAEFNMPSVILGDFNCNISESDATGFLNIFSAHGFIQHTQTSTTESGSILDLVFCKRFPDHIYIDIIPTYYGYHEAVRITTSFPDTGF